MPATVESRPNLFQRVKDLHGRVGDNRTVGSYHYSFTPSETDITMHARYVFVDSQTVYERHAEATIDRDGNILNTTAENNMLINNLEWNLGILERHADGHEPNQLKPVPQLEELIAA